MSDNIELFRKLVDHLESYEKEVGNGDIKEFSIYLRDKLSGFKDSESQKEFDKNNYVNYKTYKEVEFSTLLTGLFRFAKHYIKKALMGTSLKSIDEFGFLASLLKEKSLLKNELINKHHLEISSGSEIIKRLIKNELVQEYPDKNDKRAKRISLTNKGMIEIIGAFDEMHKVSELIIGNLHEKELNDALAVFNKLNYFHQHIYETDRQSSLNELHKKYVHGEVTE